MEIGKTDNFNFASTLEIIHKSKRIIEKSVQKSSKKIQELQIILKKEKEKNAALLKKFEYFQSLEEENTKLQLEIAEKNKKISMCERKIKDLINNEDSDSETWKQLYEANRYIKASSTIDHLELVHTVDILIAKISDSVQLKQFIKTRISLLKEIKNLSNSLLFEKLLQLTSCFFIELIDYLEESTLFSTIDSELLSSPYKKIN